MLSLAWVVAVGAKAPKVATAPLPRELGIEPIEETAVAARTRAFLKAPTLNTCISDLVAHPCRMRPTTWSLGRRGPWVGWIVLLAHAPN
jgi:hypothetical protein